MKKILIYLTLAVMAVAVIGGAWYSLIWGSDHPTPLVKPAQISLFGSQHYSGAQGSYCWSDFSGHGTCADYVSPDRRTDIPAPISVSSGSSLCFQIVDFSNPGSFHVSIVSVENSSDIALDEDVPFPNCLVVPSLTPGYYFLMVSAAWEGRETSNVFELLVIQLQTT